MKTKYKIVASMAIFTFFNAAQAFAHISYTGRDFGSYTGGDVFETKAPISISNISSDFGWAAATDANFGDSHRTRAFRFNLVSPGTMMLTVQGGVGLLPGVSLYSGLAHLSPNAAAHDSASLSQSYLSGLAGPTKVGAFYALDDWAIGNDPVYNTPNDPLSGVAIDASLRYFDYIGNIADGTSANFGSAAGINGDGIADGYISTTFSLAAGDYSFFLGGANLASETPGPTWSPYSATVSLAAIPEPSGSLLMGVAGLRLALRRRR